MKFSATLALLLLLTALAWAQPDEGGPMGTPAVRPMGGGRRQGHQELRSLHQKYEGRFQDILLRQSQRRLELAQLLRRDDVDKATVKAKLHEIIELDRQRQELLIDEYFEAKRQLSPQQFAVFRGRVLRGLLGGARRGGGQGSGQNSGSE